MARLQITCMHHVLEQAFNKLSTSFNHTYAGVIAFEAITDHPAFGFSKRQQALACARGERAYVWEPTDTASTSSAAKAFERSRISTVILQCLSRDPSQRPSALQLVRAIDRISNSTRTATSGVSAGAEEKAPTQLQLESQG